MRRGEHVNQRLEALGQQDGAVLFDFGREGSAFGEVGFGGGQVFDRDALRPQHPVGISYPQRVSVEAGGQFQVPFGGLKSDLDFIFRDRNAGFVPARPGVGGQVVGDLLGFGTVVIGQFGVVGQFGMLQGMFNGGLGDGDGGRQVLFFPV